MKFEQAEKPDPVKILLVEDNEGDIQLTRESLKKSKLYVNLNVVTDGREAMDFVNKQGEYGDAPTPDIILLDLNLPKLSGHKVLEKIKEDPDLKRIPVAVLTSSEAQEDIERSYDHHANCYITKPLGFSQFKSLVEQIEGFWFSIVQLPENQ